MVTNVPPIGHEPLSSVVGLPVELTALELVAAAAPLMAASTPPTALALRPLVWSRALLAAADPVTEVAFPVRALVVAAAEEPLADAEALPEFAPVDALTWSTVPVALLAPIWPVLDASPLEFTASPLFEIVLRLLTFAVEVLVPVASTPPLITPMAFETPVLSLLDPKPSPATEPLAAMASVPLFSPTV